MGTTDDQAAIHAEAWRRSSPDRTVPEGAPPHGVTTNAGLGIGVVTPKTNDTWSSGGAMPGVTTPDLQGPKGDITGNSAGFEQGNANTEDIVRGRL